MSSEATSHLNIIRSEALGASCLLLQREIFSCQVSQVDKYISEAIDYRDRIKEEFSSEHTHLFQHPEEDVLRDRMSLKDEKESKKSTVGSDDRILDDTEMTIMGILDADGKLSVQGRLVEFMSLMARVTSADHRALCLHILQKCLSKPCQALFVEDGGLRLLKQWIKDAQEQKLINEIKTILKVLQKLPFHEEKAKCCGLVDTLLKLAKWESKVLKTQVNDLKSVWATAGTNSKKDVGNGSGNGHSTTRNNAGTPIPLTNEQVMTTAALEEKMLSARSIQKHLIPGETVAGKAVEAAKSTSMTVSGKESGKPTISSPGSEEEHNEATLTARPTTKFLGMKVVTMNSVEQAAKIIQPAIVVPVSTFPPIDTVSMSVVEPLPPTSNSQELSTKSNFVEPSTVRATGKKIDMGAIARQAQEKAVAEQNAQAQQDQAAKADAAPKPGKGGLKRGLEDMQNGADIKKDAERRTRAKRGIRWADHEGGQLKTIELVESWIYGKNRDKNKSAADMQKDEKRMDKDMRNKRAEDVKMQKTCEWATPNKLLLSLIQLETAAAVTSEEKTKIDVRVATTADASYPDVTLIPSDPDEPVAIDSNDVATPTEDVVVIFDSGPVGGFNAEGHTANADFFEPFGAAEVQPAYGSLLYASVPEQLHFLEPVLLQLLVKDSQQMHSLLFADGSVNHTMVQTFRQHALHLPPAPPSAPGLLPPPPLRLPVPAIASAPPQRINKQASIPCTWYNTAKGCHKGDACVYGHFLQIKK